MKFIGSLVKSIFLVPITELEKCEQITEYEETKRICKCEKKS